MNNSACYYQPAFNYYYDILCIIISVYFVEEKKSYQKRELLY